MNIYERDSHHVVSLQSFIKKFKKLYILYVYQPLTFKNNKPKPAQSTEYILNLLVIYIKSIKIYFENIIVLFLNKIMNIYLILTGVYKY